MGILTNAEIFSAFGRTPAGEMAKRRVFFLFHLVSSLYEIAAHEDTVHLTVFCNPTGLYEWLVMTEDSRASSGWFVKVANEVTKSLEQEAAYLDDVIVFDYDPMAHVKTTRALFERLCKHNLKVPPHEGPLGGHGC